MISLLFLVRYDFCSSNKSFGFASNAAQMLLMYPTLIDLRPFIMLLNSCAVNPDRSATYFCFKPFSSIMRLMLYTTMFILFTSLFVGFVAGTVLHNAQKHRHGISCNHGTIHRAATGNKPPVVAVACMPTGSDRCLLPATRHGGASGSCTRLILVAPSAAVLPVLPHG